MSFSYPIVFALPLIYLALRLIRRDRKSGVAAPSTSPLSALPLSLRLRLRAPILLLLETITILALSVAAARPHTLTIIDQKTLGRNIMLVVDASNSMSGRDFPTSIGVTSRMEGVKTVVAEYVRSRKLDRVGLVVFGNSAYLQSPLTSDTLLVEKLVEQLQPRMAGDGTAIGDGLGLALKRLKDIEGESKAIILMTDGVNTAGQVNPLKAAEIARDLGIQIHTIGIGSGPVQLGAQGAIGAIMGGAVGPMVEFDEATLKEIAKVTGGIYFNATSLSGFKDVYRKIDELAQTEHDQPQKPLINELFAPWVKIALIALLTSLLLRSTIFRRLP
jgi:Ca-activated chloride channel family protein